MIKKSRIYSLLAIAIMAASALCGASCDSAAKREKASADSMLTVAKTLIQDQKYEEAFAVLATLNKRFPQQIEARREATKIGSEAMAAYSQQELINTTNHIAELEQKVDDLASNFKHITTNDIAGYYAVSALHSGNFLNTTGIEPRVDDDDYSFYIVAINNGKHIGINQITFLTDNESRQSGKIPADNDRSGDTKADGIDMASFISTEIGPISEWLIENANAIKSVKLTGKTGGEISIKFTPTQAKAITDAWQLAEWSRDLQLSRLRRDKLERQVVIARDHTVNLE